MNQHERDYGLQGVIGQGSGQIAGSNSGTVATHRVHDAPPTPRADARGGAGGTMIPDAPLVLPLPEYEARLYGYDVYYAFAQYCFWRTVVRGHYAAWLALAPAYFRDAGEPVAPED